MTEPKADAPSHKAHRSSPAAVAAAWNDDPRHPVASFHTKADADAFADAYGGVVEAIGVAFAVTGDIDTDRARSDADAARG